MSLKTFIIKDKAYKDVRPLTMEVIREIKRKKNPSTLYLSTVLAPTGRYALKFTYDRGQGTKVCTDYIVFPNEKEVYQWSAIVWNNVFTNKINNLPPPPPPPTKQTKPKMRPLSLV